MNDFEYSPVSSPAVASLLAGIAGLLGFIIPELALLGVIGATLGLLSLRSILRYQLRGLSLAIAGVLLSTVGVLGAPAWQSWRYSQESLPGYERLHFVEFESSVKSEAGNLPDSWAGRNVCLKGYALPLNGNSDSTIFLLSPDGGGGGFGARTDGVVVELGDFKAWEDAKWNAPIAVSGTLVLDDDQVTKKGFARYKLIRPTIREVLTRDDLSMRPLRGPC